MPSTSSAASGSSPSSSPASSAPASSASSARRAAASRRFFAPVSCRPSPAGSCRAAGAGGDCCCARRAAAGGASARARVGGEDPLAEALDALPADARLLLAVDQLEELFTACRSDAERAAFADALARAAADPDGRAVVVVALRADFYGRFAAYPELAELLGANQVLVGPMQASELRRAVELPAGRVGLRVEPELTDALVDDVEGEPGALPLLSTALLELWQKRQDNTLTLAAYRESGGVHGAVARLAEGTYARIPDGRKPLVRALMLRLVGEGEGDAPVRRRAPLAELDLERERGRRRRARDAGRQPPRHGRRGLGRGRPRGAAARVAAPARVDRRGRRRAPASPPHHAGGDRMGRGRARSGRALPRRPPRGRARLDRRPRVRRSTSSSASSSPRAARSRSGRRSGRGARTGGCARCSPASRSCSSAAVAGGIFAVVQRGEARERETAQLAQRLGAQALVEEDLDLSLLLARQAVAIDDTPQTRGYLLAALLRAPNAVGIMHGAGGRAARAG